MLEGTASVQNLDELRRFVAETLASLETLKADQFELSHRTLYRSGKPCAIQYCLHGPRAVRLTAIWDCEQNTVLFYGSGGQRVHRAKINGSLAEDSSALASWGASPPIRTVA
jgi:hypothetical protein